MYKVWKKKYNSREENIRREKKISSTQNIGQGENDYSKTGRQW